MERIVFYQGMKSCLAHASAKEVEQIKRFISANSKTDKNDSFRWFLAYCKNLDTGRQFLTAGGGFPNGTEGLPTSRMRELLDLPLLGRPPIPSPSPSKRPLRKLP